MSTSIVTREDINYLAQQSSGKLNMILAGMTALLNDTDNKVEMMESQTWFQRMCRTISGKNKMTKQEIQRNHDKINMYMTQAMTELFEQQCIDHQIVMSLGNQLNGLYSEHLHLKQMLGSFVAKLNEKIESVDNFHLLNTEIEQGIYSDYPSIVSICKILSQMDKRCMQDYRKMNILQRSMNKQNILNDTSSTLGAYLMSIVDIPMDDVGTIYVELESIRGNFMATIILGMIENYHFLPDMARKLKNKQVVVESVIAAAQLDPSVTLSANDIFSDLVDSKLDMFETMAEIPSEEIRSDSTDVVVSQESDDNSEVNNAVQKTSIENVTETQSIGFRMVISEVYTISGRGTVATGCIEVGSIKVNDSVNLVRPDGSSLSVVISDISIGHRLLDAASAGDEAGLLIKNLVKEDIHPNDVLIQYHAPEMAPQKKEHKRETLRKILANRANEIFDGAICCDESELPIYLHNARRDICKNKCECEDIIGLFPYWEGNSGLALTVDGLYLDCEWYENNTRTPIEIQYKDIVRTHYHNEKFLGQQQVWLEIYTDNGKDYIISFGDNFPSKKKLQKFVEFAVEQHKKYNNT